MRSCFAHNPSLAILAFLFAAGLGSKTSVAQVSSTFDTDTEGWIAAGDFAAPLTWSPADGNPGGTVSILDASVGGVTYFDAPAQFLGNHADSYGKSLTFDLRQDIGAPNQFDTDDVLLVGAGLTLAFDTPANPAVDGSWTAFTVPLTEAGWHVGSLAGAAATQGQMQSVLAALTGLRIRAEYQTGGDTDFLDNVNLEGATLFTTIANACGADLPAALFATGTLQPLSPLTLSLVGAVPDAPAVLMLGLDPATLIREGCTLLFEPAFLIPGTTAANGAWQVIGRWPDNLPTGFTVLAQAYVLDASLPKGFQTSNTVLMAAP